eukprot:TRINITY_DN7282_c0_g2_i3.p1 TRINITY_DN7282_c0_g2~~TRINITY_DN7282_c0_g2_i3.p1  ORF type:complete len:183 (-),score=30.86 TRINITY_DN7282_c0_g2_i3:52-600(-)
MVDSSTFRTQFAAHVAYALNIDVARVSIVSVDPFRKRLQVTLRLLPGATPLDTVSRDLITQFSKITSRMFTYAPIGPKMWTYLQITYVWKCADGTISTVCSSTGGFVASVEYETPIDLPPVPAVSPASKKSPPIAMIAGIVAGVVGVVATVAGIVWVRRRQAAAASQHEAAPSSNYVQLNPA